MLAQCLAICSGPLGRRTGRCVRYSAAVSGFKQAGLSRKDMSHKLSRPFANKSQKLTSTIMCLFTFQSITCFLTIAVHSWCSHPRLLLLLLLLRSPHMLLLVLQQVLLPTGAKNTVYRRKKHQQVQKTPFTGAKNTGAGAEQKTPFPNRRRKHRQPPTGAKNTVYRRNKHGAHILLCKMLLPLDHSGVCLCLVGRSYWLASPSCSCPLTVPGLFGRSCAPWPFGPKSARSSTRATRGPNALSFVFSQEGEVQKCYHRGGRKNN